MVSLDKLIVVGIHDNTVQEGIDLEEGMIHYTLNIWPNNQHSQPITLPVLYRGGYIGGFNNVTNLNKYLMVADGEGLFAYDLANPTKGYAELKDVNEASEGICATSRFVVSCWDNEIQVRSRDDIATALKDSNFSGEQIDIPYRQFQHHGKGDTVLSMIPLLGDGDENIVLNNATDKSYLIDPQQGQSQPVRFSSKQEFPYTFQRREQFHIIPEDHSKFLIFTESTSDDCEPNRVYSLDIRGPPTITELEPLELEGKQIFSMLPSENDQLTLLANHGGMSYIETLEPHQREIINSRPLGRKYELGDRLHQIEDGLLIVRHLKNEIVDPTTEESIKLTGAENDIPIPEISSTWEVPQFLYVAPLPPITR